MAARGFGDFGVRIAILMMTAQQVAGADPLIESPIAAVFGFAAGLWFWTLAIFALCKVGLNF